MLGIVADLLAGLITILFPVFASYKALKASDPAQLAPWCIYWVVLALFLLAESWTVFILGWLPFYSWIRLLVLSYLVLPQTQGAKLLYFNYISPFIEQHEHEIEAFITNAHERAMSVGLSYLNKLIDLFREKVLGLPPPQAQQAPPPQPQGYATSYAAGLLSRFNIPSARVPATPSTSDVYALLSSAISSATTTRSTASGANESGSTIAEKLSYLTSQREKLTQLLSVVDREQSSLAKEKGIEADVASRMNALDPTAGTTSGLGQQKRNKSEHSFENIDKDDVPTDAETTKKGSEGSPPNRRTQSGSWIPSSWWSTSAAELKTSTDTTSAKQDESRGRSSGFDAGQ